MNYQSFTFIAFSAFVLLVYYTVGRNRQKLVLALANITFYAASGAKYLPFLLITTAASFLAGKKMSEIYAQADAKIALCTESSEKKLIRAAAKAEAKKALQLSMFVTLILLGVCKYTGFMITNINSVLGIFSGVQIPLFRMILPLGISFYSFMALSYVLDIYWKRYPAEKSFLNFAVYLSYFPHVVQGPIDRFDEFRKQTAQRIKFDYNTVCFGAQLALWGFFKKLVIADRLGVFVDNTMMQWQDYTGVMLLWTMAVFSVQIYADFSGCIDIVTGVSEMFGIKLRKNFNHPYFSQSMGEFWRRWHISLQEWFKDYVYFPVSSSATMKKLKKSAKNRFGMRASELTASCFPILVVWLVTGIWHGAAWQYVLWGLFHAALLIGSQIFEPLFKKSVDVLRIKTEAAWWKLFRMGRTFLLCCIGRVFFRGGGAFAAFQILKRIVFEFNLSSVSILYSAYAKSSGLYLSIAAILVLLIVDIVQEKTSVRQFMAKQHIVVRWTAIFALLFSVIIFGMYGPGFDASSFIYEQF